MVLNLAGEATSIEESLGRRHIAGAPQLNIAVGRPRISLLLRSIQPTHKDRRTFALDSGLEVLHRIESVHRILRQRLVQRIA